MIIRRLTWLLAIVLIIDGAIAIVWGRDFVIWQHRVAPTCCKPILRYIMGWPRIVLRLGAAGEIVLGMVLLRRAR